MKIDVTYRKINKESHRSTRKEIRREVERHLNPHLSSFNESQLRLHVTVEKIKQEYQVSLRLHLPPKKILVSKAKNENIRKAILNAIEEVARQVERHHAHISGRENWKRKDRHQRIKNLQAEISEVPVDKQQKADKSITPLLPRIERYIRQEMTYLRANGDLLPHYPTFEDVRDEAMIRVKFKWDKLDSRDESLYQELLKSVQEILHNEVEQTRLHSVDDSIEDWAPQDAMDQAESMVGEESGEFYQPFETLHVEDLIPDDSVEDPEQQAQRDAQLQCYDLLGSLPSSWRNILVMAYQEQIPINDIAQNILEYSLDEANHLLQKAESYMMDSLKERGLGDVNRQTLIKWLGA